MFNYNVVPYAPFWSMRVIKSEIEELDQKEIDVPVFDREWRAAIKYQIAESLELKTMEIFRKIWCEKETKQLIATGFENEMYNDALKKLLLNTSKAGPTIYIKIEDIEVDNNKKNKFKVTWENLPGCFKDTINHFDRYFQLKKELDNRSTW